MNALADRISHQLAQPTAAEHLRAYFDDRSDGNRFTGRHFETLGGGGDRTGNENQFTATDLIAIEALSVSVLIETAVELIEGPGGRLAADMLRRIPTDAVLGSADATLHIRPGSPADDLWGHLTKMPGVGWVIAGKLMARKRPHLIPVYDDVVRCVLGHPDNFWLELDEALRSHTVRNQIAELRTAGAVPAVVSDLRIIDVILWMSHRVEHRAGDCGANA
ncbi:DUF6308 family protein [Nocardioides marmorisolisilvae]|uniref:Uncharacterized protein n=1 Tax=Nocardioides marmorisolisilvae TaxID=1542737 RepID=A0A3N0DVR2_9ACTN|nr:DUF6308 family protein [Nocardioides marmorisolisilvae]RNL79712.1 hypothetical protein EFL95_12175 [Nocardioides marmorisolisilvae]